MPRGSSLTIIFSCNRKTEVAVPSVQEQQQENTANTTERFIIPQKGFGIIAQYEDNLIKEIGKIDVPYASKSVILKNGLIVSLCFDEEDNTSEVRIFDKDGNLLSRKTEYKFDSINCKDNVVYLGGRWTDTYDELFSYIDLTIVNFKINEIELPVKSVEGKSIDDILICGNTMYLVDDIIYGTVQFLAQPDKLKKEKTGGANELSEDKA